MTLMNATKLKDARTNRFKPEYGGGQGYTIFQFGLGVVAFLAVLLLFLLLGLRLVGFVVAVIAGIGTAIAPNIINTHHQNPQDYLRGQLKKQINRNRTLILNDQRFAEPPDESTRYVVEVSELQNPIQEE